MSYFLIKCIVLGDVGVGKTSIIHNRILNQIKQVQSMPMEYVSRSASPVTRAVSTFDYADFNKISDSLEYEKMVAKYFEPPHAWEEAGGRHWGDYSEKPSKPCALVVFDTTNRESFEHVKHWVQMAKKYGGEDTYIVLAGTKIDLSSKVSRTEAQELADELRLNLYYINSKARVDKSGVYDVFGDMIDEMHIRKQLVTAEEIESARREYRQRKSSRCVVS